MWEPVITFEVNTSWQLSQPITTNLFRIRQLTTAVSPANLRGVVAQAFQDSTGLTVFDSRRLVFKTELEAFLFLDPGRLYNRKIAVKRLDNLTDDWVVVIETLPEVGEINLPINIGDVAGLQEQLDTKELIGTGAAQLEAHLEALDPHPQYLSSIPTAASIGAELAGTAAALLEAHLATVDPHATKAIHVDCTPPAGGLITAVNTQTAIDQIAEYLAQLQAQLSILSVLNKAALVFDTFVDADNRALDQHNPDTYQTGRWNKRAGGWVAVGGRAKSDGTAASLAWIDATQGQKVVIECDVLLVDTNVSQGLIFRFSANNNYHWRAVYTKTKWEILEVTSGVSSRANLAESVAFGNIYRFKVLLENENLTFFVNNARKLSWISANNQAETKHGLYASSSVTTQFDNFKVTEI